MKKYLALLLTLCMVFSLFSGLGITVSATESVAWQLGVRLAPMVTEDEPRANNEKATVAMHGNEITITVDVDELEESMSTNPGQQDKAHKWIWLAIDTGLDSVTQAAYQGEALTEVDAQEAKDLDLEDGEFILFVKADELVTTPKTFTLGAAEHDDVTVTICIHNYVYSASGNVVTETCDHCSHTATATITADDATYTGSAIENAASVAYTDNWMGGELEIAYEDNTNVGTAKAKIALDDATAETTFSINKKSDGYTLELGNLYQHPDNVSAVTTAIDPEDTTATYETQYLDSAWKNVSVRLAPSLTEEIPAANNAKATVEMFGNSIRIEAPLAELVESESSDPVQKLTGPHKWIGLGINTGFSDVTKVSYNGSPLTADDKNDAQLVGLGDGEFVLYIKADEVVNTGKNFSLSADGYPTESFNIYIWDTSLSDWSVSARLAPSDKLTDPAVAANNAKATVEWDEYGNYIVTAPLGELTWSMSSDSGQQDKEHQWIALGINTGFADLTKVSYNGSQLTETDKEEAESVGLDNGEFVLYIRADELANGYSKWVDLDADGYYSYSMRIRVVDSTQWNTSVRLAPSDKLTDPAVVANNAKAEIETYGNNISVMADLGELTWSLSSNEYQQDKECQWIALGINTGFDDLTKVSYNSDQLTETDQEEAKSVGLDDGEFVLYIRADELVNGTKTVKLQADGYPTEWIYIHVEDTSLKQWNVSLRLAPSDKLTDPAVAANNAKAELKVGEYGELVVAADVGDLKWSLSSDSNQQDSTHKWIALGINTGFDDLTNVTYINNYGIESQLTAADQDEATSVGLDNGEFVLYIRADELTNGNKKWVGLSAEGYQTKWLDITVEHCESTDREPMDITARFVPSQTDATVATNNEMSLLQQSENLIMIATDVSELKGARKIGLAINTGLDDLTKVTFIDQYGYARQLTEAEDLDNGEFVLYVDVPDIFAWGYNNSLTFKLDAEGYAETEVIVVVNDLDWLPDVPTEEGVYKVRSRLASSDNIQLTGMAGEPYTYGELTISAKHKCNFTVSGNVISATCEVCGNVATATVVAEDVMYLGRAIEYAHIDYANDWDCGDLTIEYENNVNPGLATAKATIGGATAVANFNIIRQSSKPSVTPSAPASSTTEEQKPEEQKPEEQTEVPAAVKDFVDVPAKAWYTDSVAYVVTNSLMNGVSATSFAPEATMTRAMLMTVLARNAGADTTGGATWYEKSMEWAKETGISDGTNPNGDITREQLVTMLYRAAKEPEVTGELNFTDAASVSEYAQRAMIWAVANGIITGMGNGMVAPTATATRAQVATILMRYLELGK